MTSFPRNYLVYRFAKIPNELEEMVARFGACAVLFAVLVELPRSIRKLLGVLGLWLIRSKIEVCDFCCVRQTEVPHLPDLRLWYSPGIRGAICELAPNTWFSLCSPNLDLDASLLDVLKCTLIQDALRNASSIRFTLRPV